MDMIYFGGCSITMGAGFDRTQQDPRIYPNLIRSDISCAVINEADGGSSNLKIFTKAAKAIMDDRAQIYVVQWSAPHRHWVYPRPDQGIYIGAPHERTEHRGLVEQYQLRNHDYPNLMCVIDYSRILVDLARYHCARMIFVNGMLNWSLDWQDLYMESLLEDLNEHDREDFRERFSNNLDLLDLSIWANPWCSILQMQEDQAPLDNHPGPKTHQKIAELVKSVIDKQKGVS